MGPVIERNYAGADPMGFLIPGQELGKTPGGATKSVPKRGQSEDTGRVLISRAVRRGEPEVGGTWQIPVIELREKEPWKDIGVPTLHPSHMLSCT